MLCGLCGYTRGRADYMVGDVHLCMCVCVHPRASVCACACVMLPYVRRQAGASR